MKASARSSAESERNPFDHNAPAGGKLLILMAHGGEKSPKRPKISL